MTLRPGHNQPVDELPLDVDTEMPGPEADSAAESGPDQPPLDPGTEEASQLRTWEVVVLDPSGEPIPGVTVATAIAPRSGHRPWETAVTDASGTAVVSGLDAERFEVVTKGVVPWERWTLTEPCSVLQYSDLLPLEVTVIDARTGLSMGPGCGVTLLGASSGQRSLEWRDDRFVLSLSPAWRSGPVFLRFKVEVPQGFAVLTREVEDSREMVSSYATGIRARVIARPEARIRLRFLDAEGAPVPGIGVQSATLGWIYPQNVGADLSGDDGVLVVRGVPDLPGENLRLIVEGGKYSAAVDPIALDGVGELHEATVVLRSCYRGPSGSVNGCPRFVPDPEAPEGGTSTVEFTVRRHGGVVASETMVRLEGECLRRSDEGAATVDAWRLEAATDAKGQVVFTKVPGGRVLAEVRQAGFVWMREECEVVEGDAQRVTLDEPAGRTVRVAVLDSRGASVPFASLEVRLACGVPYASPCDGVQDLGLWTDSQGICEIMGMPETEAEVFATIGSRTRSGRLEPRDGALRIELPEGR